MSFRPSSGNILINTREWTEEQLPIKVHYTERTYTTPDGPNNLVRVTTKTTTGPPGAMQRRKLAKFGDAGEDSGSNMSIGQDVFFELVSPTHTEQEYVPNGVYVTCAREAGWSDSDIKRIIRSDQPDQVYLKISRSKINAASTTIATTTASTTATTSATTTTTATTSAPKGLRGLMQSKQQKRLGTPESGKKTLSSVLHQRRHGPERDESKCTLFVENIPEDYQEADIKEHIAEFQYRRVNIVRRDGESIGKAFIELDSEADAEACLQAVHGSRWSYCVVSAQYAKPKSKN